MLYHVVVFFNAATMSHRVVSTHTTLAAAQADHAARYLAASAGDRSNLGITSSDIGSAISTNIGTAE